MKMRRYEGKCEIEFDTNTTVAADFELVFTEDGKMDIVCSTDEIQKVMKLLSKNQSKARLQGTTIEPLGKIQIPEMYLNAAKLPEGRLTFDTMSPVEIDIDGIEKSRAIEVRFGLSNFAFNGCEISKIGNWHVRDKFTVEIKNHKIIFRWIKNHKKIIENLRRIKGVQITSEAISHIRSDEIDKLRAILKNLESLLSFASGNYITTLYEDIYNKGKLTKTILNPFKTMSYNHREFVIDCDHHWNCDLKEFLETTYARFESLRHILGLGVVIEYYVTSKIVQIIQVKYLLGAVAFECLKSHFSEYLKKKGKPPVSGSFREKMKTLFSEFRVTHTKKDLQFIDIRNSIVHEGDFPRLVRPHDEVLKLYNLIDRTILTILGFKGNHYLNIEKQFQRETLQ